MARWGWPRRALRGSRQIGVKCALGRGEVGFDVVGDVRTCQGADPDRAGLLEEGAPPVSEQSVHHVGVAAGEEVGDGAGVMLDMAAQHAVEIWLGGEHLLELIVGDQAASARPFVQASGSLEQVVQPRERVGVGGRTSELDVHHGWDTQPCQGVGSSTQRAPGTFGKHVPNGALSPHQPERARWAR